MCQISCRRRYLLNNRKIWRNTATQWVAAQRLRTQSPDILSGRQAWRRGSVAGLSSDASSERCLSFVAGSGHLVKVLAKQAKLISAGWYPAALGRTARVQCADCRVQLIQRATMPDDMRRKVKDNIEMRCRQPGNALPPPCAWLNQRSACKANLGAGLSVNMIVWLVLPHCLIALDYLVSLGSTVGISNRRIRCAQGFYLWHTYQTRRDWLMPVNAVPAEITGTLDRSSGCGLPLRKRS